MRKFKWSAEILVALSGAGLGAVYTSKLPAVLIPFFLVPFFWYFLGAKESISSKRSVIVVALFFLPFHIVVLSWFLDADLGLLLNISRQSGDIYGIVCLLIMAVWLSFLMLPIAFALRYISNVSRQPGLLPLLFIICSWALLEWVRSIGFSVFLYGNQGSVGDYWNFGSLGLGLMDTPLAYASRIVGLYGLSMFAVGLAIAICWAKKGYYKALVCLVALVCCVSTTGYVLYALPDETAVAHGSTFQRSGNADDFNNVIRIRNVNDADKDLIILPEYSEVFETSDVGFSEVFVNKRLAADGVSIDVGMNSSDHVGRYGTTYIRDNQGHVLTTQTKQLLIPTGEYMPYILTSFFDITGKDSFNNDFFNTRLLSRGEPPHIIEASGIKVAPVACSGILGRNIYRNLVNEGGQVLTNSASLLIFNNSQSYFKQSLQMARFHAIANNKTFIQASKGAPSFVLSERGKYIVKPETTDTLFSDFEFRPNNRKTMYTQLGDWPLMLSGFLVAGFVGYELLKTRKKSSK